MVGLGNILEPESKATRGPDLHCSVQVPRSALGRADGVSVKVAATLDYEGQPVPRAMSAHDPDETVRLHLPADMPQGAVLRLRGQGGLLEGASPGDLYVTVEVVEGRPTWIYLVLVAALILGALSGALLIDV